MNEIVIVVTGAMPLDPVAVASMPDHGIVLAADGAFDHALAAGLRPAGLVGDLDSVSAAGLAWASEYATIERHDPRKDRTDTELALAMAVQLDPARLVLLSGGGDRLDHTIAAIGALGHPSLTSIPVIDGWWGDQCFHVLHGPGRLRLALEPGTTLSLLALHGGCAGVTVAGVEWPLDRAELPPLVGLGVSNVATADRVELAVSTGVLTVFVTPSPHPHDPTDPEERPR